MPLQNYHLLKNSTGCTTVQFIEKKFKAIFILTTTQALYAPPTECEQSPQKCVIAGLVQIFWIQNLRLFCQYNNFFFQTQGYQIGDQ